MDLKRDSVVADSSFVKDICPSKAKASLTAARTLRWGLSSMSGLHSWARARPSGRGLLRF